MKTIYEIRHTNASALLRDRCGGVKSRLGAKMSWSRQLTYQYLRPRDWDTPERDPDAKRIGDDVARRMEAEFEMPHGWMDNDHDEIAPLRQDAESVDVPTLPERFQAKGSHRSDHEVLLAARISKTWLRGNVSYSDIDNLALLTHHGDDMDPTLSDGSTLLVDRGSKNAGVDGIYVLHREDQLFVKRIARRLDGGITVISDNHVYPQQTIERPGDAGIVIVGRVIANWCAEKV